MTSTQLNPYSSMRITAASFRRFSRKGLASFGRNALPGEKQRYERKIRGGSRCLCAFLIIPLLS